MELSDSLENERQLKSDLNLLRNDISKRINDRRTD